MASHEYEYLIALGSNTGDRLAQLNQAVESIHSLIGPVTSHSTVYETEPMGAADALFLNSAIRVLSNLNPDKVMASLLYIEKNLGRVRTEKWGNRSIDLDILLVQTKDRQSRLIQAIVDSETLTIPHPEMLQRDFVMIPASEIAGDWIHPKTNGTLTEETVGRFSALPKINQGTWNLKGKAFPTEFLNQCAPTPTFI